MYWKVHESDDVQAMSIHDGDGLIKRRDFFSDVSKLPIRMELWELDPGASEGNHIHDGEDALEEQYYFLAGEGVMWVEGEEIPIAAGEAVLVPPGIDHGFRNTGDVPLRLVIIWGKPVEE